MRILFITPHLSTGGAPQYLLKKIQELIDEHDVYCIEYSNITGGVFVVQRKQISDILGDKLMTLDENKAKLLKIIDIINPDVVHFEEMPEYFCDRLIANQIYNSNRKYKIIETSHDSSFNPDNKCFFPDRFIFVSPYQKEVFKSLNIPSDIVEYPIVYRTKTDRTTALKELNLDPNKTHFLNVGLFTSRKNQAEIIEYAKHLLDENVQFHFVGNQADNFKWYWEPLMKDFPKNCKWWGERKDVDKFYNAMDIFLFTSKGTSHDKETNPLVVKESIGWNMPLLMYNLPVYCGMYNKYKNITWLENDFYKNLNILKSFISNKNLNQKELLESHIYEHNNKIDKLHKELFEINFNEFDNKLNILYTGEDILKNVRYTVKDVDSRTCIYSCNWEYIQPNVWVWLMPLPKHVYDFVNDTNFRGFLFQVYNERKEKIYETEIILKNINNKKPIIEFSDEQPIFNNYNEFFVDKIYDDLNIKNLDCCFDLGANVGLFTKYLKTINCNKVFCFEPNKLAFESLEKNLKNEDNIKLFNLAVSHNNKPLRLYIDDGNSLISSACDVKNNYYDVQTTTLKDILLENKIDNVDLIKIDIEGMEFDLIDNLDDSIFNKVDRFLIEYHDFYFKDGAEKLEGLKSKLSYNGYNIVNKHKFIYAEKRN
jgi:FkbM family methyltransferase